MVAEDLDGMLCKTRVYFKSPTCELVLTQFIAPKVSTPCVNHHIHAIAAAPRRRDARAGDVQSHQVDAFQGAGQIGEIWSCFRATDFPPTIPDRRALLRLQKYRSLQSLFRNFENPIDASRDHI